MFGLPGLSVETRKRTSPNKRVSRVTSRRPSTWPVKSGRVDIGRRRRDRAAGRRRKGGAVAGERSAQVGNDSVALPVGDGEKFRRHDIERRSPGHKGAARIGVVAAAEFNRGFDQKTAGVIADRAERIVIDSE